MIDLEQLDHAPELPAIDMDAPVSGTGPWVPDRRSFEERYADLGFGLGVVPRKVRRDDAFWETPAGVVALLAGLLALVLLLATAH